MTTLFPGSILIDNSQHRFCSTAITAHFTLGEQGVKTILPGQFSSVCPRCTIKGQGTAV
uniref:Uncharacterized protein n=1 Tax=Anguilla anguilla TaxID=7936 RepID=A0A0E9XDK2_ANGAN